MTLQRYYDGNRTIHADEMQEIWNRASKEQFFGNIVIAAGYVWKVGIFGGNPVILGPLKGAYAGVTDGTPVHRVGAAGLATMAAGPAGLLVGLSKKVKAAAVVALANGRTIEHKLDGNGQVRRAQRDAIRFNARAGAA